jgi:micrococcal nuclease
MPIGALRVTLVGILLVAAISLGDAAEFSGRVKAVIDGDDIVLCDGGGSCRQFRLCGINAPESKCRATYKRARDGLRGLALDKMARCIQVGDGTPCDGKSKPTNRGRIVAQCFIGTTDIAGSLVERGLACDWEMFSGGYYSRNGKGLACPPDHRLNCTGIVPQRP